MPFFAIRLRYRPGAQGEHGAIVPQQFRWERGVHEPGAEHLRALARVLEVTADYLLGLKSR
jgi:hypothetical protein